MKSGFELTDGQISEWIRLNKLQNICRKWSVEGLSAQEAKKRQDALDNYPKVMMESEEGRAGMNALLEKIFYESDFDNMGSLTGQDFWTLFEKLGAHHDTLPGIMGHWIMDKTVWDQNIGFYMKTLATNGRMTFDRWLETWGIYMEKILPNLKDKPVELNDVQIAEWIRLNKLRNVARKWSVEGLLPQEAKKRQDALANYTQEMMQCEEGKAGLMAFMENLFYDCDSENRGSLTGRDIWAFKQKQAAHHDTLPGIMGHWIEDKRLWFQFTDWLLPVCGTDGRLTLDQYKVVYKILNEKVAPNVKDKPVELTDDQIAEWIRLNKLQNKSRKWSGLSAREAKKRQDALENYPKVMMQTEKGLTQMMDDMERIFYESDSENMGSLTGEDLWTFVEKQGAQYDNLPGIMGHWVLDKTVWDDGVGWFMKTLGTGGRVTYDQFLGVSQIYNEKVLPHMKDKPVELTDGQIAEWTQLIISMNATRKWSVEGLSPLEAMKRQKTFENYPTVMFGTEKGQAEIMAVLEQTFYESDSENMGSLTVHDFWTWIQKFGASHDTVKGIMGHWIFVKTTWDQMIDWLLKACGTDGRMTFDQFLAAFQAYNEKVLPLTKDKPVVLTDEQCAKWLQLIKKQNFTRKWSVEGLSPQEAKRRQDTEKNYLQVMMQTEKGQAEMMALFERVFFESDSENMGSLTVHDFWTWYGKLCEYYDTVKGIMGHWVMDKTVWDQNMTWYMSVFGSGGRMTYDQWQATFPIWMEKIQPHLKD